MSPQRSRRRNAAARLAAAATVAGIVAGTLVMAPAASAASTAQDTTSPVASTTSDVSPPVSDTETVSPYELGVVRLSSAPGKSVYVTDEGDSITVSFEDGETGGPTVTIRTAGGGWVGVLSHRRTGPLTSPFSGCEFRLVDGGNPYLDIRLGVMSGRVYMPTAPPAKVPAHPDTATEDAVVTQADPDTTTTDNPPAEPPNSSAPQSPSARISTQQRAMPQGPDSADGTNLILYAGGALIAAAAITGVAVAVLRRDPDGRP